MGMWMEIGERRYEVVPIDTLNLLQMVQASKETGLSPERLEELLTNKDASSQAAGVEQLAAAAVVVWAARLHAGERLPTVASAVEGVPLRDLTWGSDEPEEPEQAPDPTLPGSAPDGSNAPPPSN